MKKLLLLFLFICFIGISQAQNVQFLYGYGKQSSVNFVTTELYKTLDRGPLYYFTDFKFDKNGYYESYTEISKYWYISRNGLSLTAQYNVGVNKDFRINPVYLIGLSKATKINDVILSMDVLYRIDKFTNNDGVQLTFQFLKYWNKLQLSGYCDVWDSGEYVEDYSTQNSTIILFEPQIFYKISKRFYAGIEGRLSNYTVLEEYDNYVMFGLKWNLEN